MKSFKNYNTNDINMINILDDEDKQIIKISKQPLKEYTVRPSKRMY